MCYAFPCDSVVFRVGAEFKNPIGKAEKGFNKEVSLG